MPAGRPTTYSDELAAKICEELATSGDGLKKICEREDMPSRSTVFLWLLKYPGFSDIYTKAKEAQMDLMAEEIIEIADDSSEDYIKLGDDGDGPSIKFDSEHVNRARLRVDTRKWIMARLSPKKYGDKLQQEITGPGGVQPVLNILVSPIAPKALPESEE